MKKQGRNMHMLLFILSLFILFISGILFCFYTMRDSKEPVQLVLTYLDNNKGLEIDNTSPITDLLGKEVTFHSDDLKTGYAEFSLSTNFHSKKPIAYEICLSEEDQENSISSRYIKLYLTDANTDMPLVGFNKKVLSFYELKVAKSDAHSKGLYKGVLRAGEVKDFRLRMWLDDSYIITDHLEKFKINLTVRVID